MVTAIAEAALPRQAERKRRSGVGPHVTYCLAMLLDEGQVKMADTRTNAGADNFSSYRKLHALVAERERQIFVATAGNLSVSHAMVSLLREDLASTASSVPPPSCPRR